MGKNVGFDEEVELESDEEEEPIEDDTLNDEEEEEEDEEEQDDYENDGFIVDDVDEEDGERGDSDEERRKKKKKRKKKEAEELDEDDYELLRENDVNGPKGSKKLKRLKKAQRDLDDGRLGLSDDEFDGSMTGQPLEDIPEDEEQIKEEEDGGMGEEDEMADFIVDEEYEHGYSVRRKKMKDKKSRQTPGTSQYALQEAQDIFGDVDEILWLRKQGLDSSELKERRLEDEFEPAVLSEKYMTEKDDHIRVTDIPERMQIFEESTGTPPTDEMSIIEESTWIHNQLISSVVPLYGKERQDLAINKDDITRFLKLTHVEKLDIPFIATYRKGLCRSLLKDPEQHEDSDVDQDKSDKTPKVKWHRVLWAIQNLDRKWLLLQKRKRGLQSHYNKRFAEECRRVYDETRLNLNQQFFESILKDLKDAESEREVDDVDAKFNLHFPPGEVGVDEGQYKRPKRRSQYSICNKAGLWEVVSKFGYSAEQLGSHLSLEKMVVELEDAKETPEEMASNYTCSMFETPQDVLKGARHMAAVEISCEPSVKKYVRDIYMPNVVVSTSPTLNGKIAVDSFHQFAGVKWLREKPLNRFEDAQWLLIQKAEEENLLQVTIKLPEKSLNEVIRECNDKYLSNGVSKSAQQWNEQRKLILSDVLFGFLFPSMEKEARSLLASRAKNWLLLEYGKALWNKVSVAPYQRKGNDINSDEETAPRVMACCWGPGKPATTFVMLDSSGEVLDVLYTVSLTLRSQNVNDQQCKKNDQQRVLKFMTDHRPHVVVLGAVNLSCTRLKDDIYEIIFKMVEENPRDVGHEMDELSIVYGDESLPRIYENSRISSDQLPGQSGIVKRAVALGRYLQNPLAMVATLCGPGKEILSWKLTPLENFILTDEKYGIVEQVLADVINQVGLDVNLAASHEWLFAPLQFISGLGPRKAASLQRSLVRVKTIFTRKDFTKKTHGLGKKVFENAVGFLRVRRSGLAANSIEFIDWLDDTRIHPDPESFSLAKEFAKDVYADDLKGENYEDALEMALELARDRPSLLKRLRLDEYLKSKEDENKRQSEEHGDKRETEEHKDKKETKEEEDEMKKKERKDKMESLNFLRREFILGFQDWRKQYKEPSQDEEFFMITGETEDTLAEGRHVQATVRRVQGGRAICVLESGLTGMIMKENYADDWRDIIELSDRVHEGDILTCKIKSVQKNRYQVFLVCKDSEMRSNQYQYAQNLDPYYHEEESSLQSEQEKARKEKEQAKKHLKPRMIVHPRFQNITANEAMEYLSDKDPGESIIRPSSRGPSHLTLTLKVYDGVYAHKDIVEGGKEHNDITSMLRIGKALKIGEDTFEDLDEVIDRYIDPLASHLKLMLNYRKFRRGNKKEVDELLRIEKSECPKRIVYSFGICDEYPGTFILTYIRNTNPHHEYIGLYPKGFKFRKKMFEDLDRLVAYFQKHIDDPQLESSPSIRSVAAMVPMRSPASTNESGWKGHSFGRGQSSTLGSITGRNEYRNSSSQDGNPSGVPRPFGGRGRGRSSYNSSRGQTQGQDSSYGDTPKWDSGTKKWGDVWGNFPGAKVQNSPGREVFPGGWGQTVSDNSKGRGWDTGGGESGGGWGQANSDNGKGGGWNTAGTESGRGSGSGGWGQAISDNSKGGGWNTAGTESGRGSGGGGWGQAISDNSKGGGWNTAGTESRRGSGGGGWGQAISDNSKGGGWNTAGTESRRGSGGSWNSAGTESGRGSGGGGWGQAISDNSKGGGWNTAGTESGRGSGGGGWGQAISDNSKGGGWNTAGTESGRGSGGGGWGQAISDNSKGVGWNTAGTESRRGSGGGSWGQAISDNSKGGGWNTAGTESGRGSGGGWNSAGTESGSSSGGGWGQAISDSGKGGSGWGSVPKGSSHGGRGWSS